MRRIAAEVGCSTSVLYTMFGGKSGVAEGLWREGFERLRQALEQADGADPLGRLAAMGRAYRENALANRAYYAVMFQRPIPGFQPSAEAYAESLRPLQLLVGAVADCIDAGVFRAADPAHSAGVLWAAAPRRHSFTRPDTLVCALDHIQPSAACSTALRFTHR